jgi:hypothetical protein
MMPDWRALLAISSPVCLIIIGLFLVKLRKMGGLNASIGKEGFTLTAEDEDKIRKARKPVPYSPTELKVVSKDLLATLLPAIKAAVSEQGCVQKEYLDVMGASQEAIMSGEIALVDEAIERGKPIPFEDVRDRLLVRDRAYKDFIREHAIIGGKA